MGQAVEHPWLFARTLPAEEFDPDFHNSTHPNATHKPVILHREHSENSKSSRSGKIFIRRAGSTTPAPRHPADAGAQPPTQPSPACGVTKGTRQRISSQSWK
jgi:hypothetical protein